MSDDGYDGGGGGGGGDDYDYGGPSFGEEAYVCPPFVFLSLALTPYRMKIMTCSQRHKHKRASTKAKEMRLT